MARRVTATAFVGRSDELRRITQAAADASGHGQLVLVGGDAGIGKSRLVAEVCLRWRAAGGLALVGSCVDLGEVGAAHAPLIEILRRLRLEQEADTDRALQELAPELIPLLARGAAGGSVGDSAVLAQAAAFLDALGGALVVIEDLHWADASTQDLVRYLSRNLATTRIALVLTYRTDDLHRRHPVRPLLAELQRVSGTDALRLEGMSRSEITVLLTDIAGTVPSDADVDSIVARADGNPFHVEELAAARSDGAGVPTTIRDAIDARLARLDPMTGVVLREAAVVGEDIDVRLLGAVSGRIPEVVTAALHEAVAHQVLVLTDGRCRFRHALWREAMYDDLLPGERQRLHEAAADAFEDRDDGDHVGWARIAHHRIEADDQPRALRASVAAAVAAERVGALADAALQYRRALRLWPRVAGAADVATAAWPDVLLRAAHVIGHAGAPEEAATLVETALVELGTDGSPEDRAALLCRLRQYRWAACDTAGAGAAASEAVDAVADRPPTVVQAEAFAALGRHEMLVDRFADAEATLATALAVAAEVGADVVRAVALPAWGFVLVKRGRTDEGVEASREGLALAEAVGTADDRSAAHIMLAATLLAAGRFTDTVAASEAGLDHARRTGMLASDGVLLRANLVYARYALGRWDEALDALDAIHAAVAGSSPHGTTGQLPAAWIANHRGQHDDAAALVESILSSPNAQGDLHPEALACAAAIAGAQDRIGDARRLIADAMAAADGSEDLVLVAAVGSTAAEIERRAAELAALAGLRRQAQLAAAAAGCALAIEGVRMRIAGAGDVAAPAEALAHLATAEAIGEQVDGRPDPDRWASVAARWEALGCAHAAASARLAEADAVLRQRGDRARATAAARTARATASDLGAVPLLEAIDQLAARARLDLEAPTEAPVDPVAALGVSPRERQVLELLAQGRTNKQIAEALFISDKTASVHVTHLLRKLGAASRIEAAALGQRLGLGLGA